LNLSHRQEYRTWFLTLLRWTQVLLSIWSYIFIPGPILLPVIYLRYKGVYKIGCTPKWNLFKVYLHCAVRSIIGLHLSQSWIWLDFMLVTGQIERPPLKRVTLIQKRFRKKQTYLNNKYRANIIHYLSNDITQSDLSFIWKKQFNRAQTYVLLKQWLTPSCIRI
jgi:hypothetical protein